MIFKEEVCMWFKKSEPHHRLGLICGLLNMCLPLELRFIQTCLEDLGKRDDILKDSHVKANNIKEVGTFGKVLDERTCSKLIIYIALLEADNQPCSKLLYEMLSKSLVHSDNDILANPSKSEVLVDQLLLLYTMVLNHPAFTCEEKKLIGEKLVSTQQLQDEINLARTSPWPKQSDPKEAQKSCSSQEKDSCHLDQTASTENNQNNEACDSGLSIGTEPEGEVLSDHSCVPSQTIDQPGTIPSKAIADLPQGGKEFEQKWSLENDGCGNNIMHSLARASVSRAEQSPLSPINSIQPVQGAMSSSSGESLNLCSEASSVPTTYIYNSSIMERNALNEAAPANALPIKKKCPVPETHATTNKAHKVTSAQSSPLSSPYVSPPQSLNPSRVSSPKAMVSIVSCQASLVTGTTTSLVISKSTTRPPPPRQCSSSSSSSGSHPSSPAFANIHKKPLPTNNRRYNRGSPGVTLPLNIGDSSALRNGPYSNTIAFFPPLDGADDSQLNIEGLTNTVKPSHQKVFTSAATVPTTTITMATAANDFKKTHSSCDFDGKTADTKTSYSNSRLPNGKKINDRKDSIVSENVNRVRGHPLTNGVSAQSPNYLPSFAHSHNGFPALQHSYRFHQHNYFIPPPNIMHANDINLSGPPPNHFHAHARNAKNNSRNGSNSSLTGNHSKKTVKSSSTDTSPSSSRYSSPPQTPSPDINGQAPKQGKKKTGETGDDTPWECLEHPVSYSMPPPLAATTGDNCTPPPGSYPQFMAPSQHHRSNSRYMTIPGHMGLMGYPPHGGLYRLPLHSSQMMLGPRPPSVPLSGSEKSSREATPPNMPSAEVSAKNGDCTVPAASPVMPRGSHSASPPDSEGHPPHPMPPTNYSMFTTAPFFTHYHNYMPAHSSVPNSFVAPPSYSLPPINSELMYPTPYPLMNPYPPPSAAQTAPYPYPLIPPNAHRSKKNSSCYNCGHVGHRGTECKEASMRELTRTTHILSLQNT